MRKYKTIKIIGFAQFQAFLFALLGAVAGVLYSFGGLIYDVVTTGSVNGGTALAFLALIGMPLIFATVGFLTGLVESILFNLYIKYIGDPCITLGLW